MIKSTRPEPPREAALIEAARRRERLTVRKAADQAGISEARWRQITSGYQSIGKGEYKEVEGPADTVARMAQAVRVTPDQLRGVGREDAAQSLEEITPDPSDQAVVYTPPVDAVYEILAALPPAAQEEVIRRLRRPPDPPAAEPRQGNRRHAG